MSGGDVNEAPIPLHYIEALVRAAARRWWRRSHDAVFWIASALCVGCFVVVLRQGAAGWFLGAYGAGLAIVALFSVGVYAIPLRRSLATFRSMGAATLRLGADTFEVASAAGSITLPWTAVERVEAYPEVWLVIYSAQQYSTFPAADLPDEARAFITARVRATGGKA